MIVPPAQIKNPLDGNQKILSNPSYSRIPAKSVKTDFFIMEAPTDPFKKLWNKNSKTFPKNLLEMEVILRMQLVKVGKKMHLVNTRNYYFTDEYIYYKKNENSKIKGVMNFNIVVSSFCEPVKNIIESKNTKKNKFSDYYVINFIKNRVSRELMTKNYKSYTDIFQFLRFKCILTSFHDEFTVIKNIGKGSFARVFLCKKNLTNNYYAVKCFKKEYILTQMKGKESLINEISIMRKINHPNLLKIYEVYESDNSIYIVLDLIEGGELFARLTSKAYYDEEKLAKLLANLLSPLAHLHKLHIIHRDLKPENILLKSKESDTDIVIADFGLSTDIIFLEKILFKRCGTPGFVAPEVLNYDEKKHSFYNEKCDIFSVGVIFYILLSGKKPFDGKDCKTILRNNKKCSINFALEEFKKVSPSAMNLLRKMLAENPSFRPTAQEALCDEFLKSPNPQKIEDMKMIENFASFRTEHQKALKNNGSDTLGSLKNLFTGSNRFEFKSPILNGKTDTFETLESSLSIKIKNEFPDEKRGSRFSPRVKNSNFSHMGLASNENVEGIQSERKISKSSRKSESTNNEYYKKALMNSTLPKSKKSVFREEIKEIEMKSKN